MSETCRANDLRPWQHDPDEPVTLTQMFYLWKSSIPQNWIRIRGEDHFLKAEEKKPVNAMGDLIKGMQEAADALPPAETVRSKRMPPLKAKDSSRDSPTVDLLAELSPRTIVPELHGSRSLRTFQQHTHSRLRGLWSPNMSKSPSLQVHTFAFQSADSAMPEGYVVNKYSRPRALVPLRRTKPAAHGHFQSDVGQFLHRFEAKPKLTIAQKVRKGVNGWKYTKPKKPQALTARCDRPTHLPAKSEPLVLPDCRDEPYLRYLCWKDSPDLS